MSCSPSDLTDYLLGELADTERRRVDRHVKSCHECGAELDRLRLTQTALLSLPEEEMPQRIGFVSDKVYEPSPWRRAWSAFWGSAPRLGFASAAMLSAALVISAWHRPPVILTTPAAPPAAQHASLTDQEIAGKVDAAVRAAVERERKQTAAVLAALEKRQEFERQAMLTTVQENLAVMQKRYNVMLIASGGPAEGAR